MKYWQYSYYSYLHITYNMYILTLFLWAPAVLGHSFQNSQCVDLLECEHHPNLFPIYGKVD